MEHSRIDILTESNGATRWNIDILGRIKDLPIGFLCDNSNVVSDFKWVYTRTIKGEKRRPSFNFRASEALERMLPKAINCDYLMKYNGSGNKDLAISGLLVHVTDDLGYEELWITKSASPIDRYTAAIRGWYLPAPKNIIDLLQSWKRITDH